MSPSQGCAERYQTWRLGASCSRWRTVPPRMEIRPGSSPSSQAQSWVPHVAQNAITRRLPLSAVFTYVFGLPDARRNPFAVAGHDVAKRSPGHRLTVRAVADGHVLGIHVRLVGDLSAVAGTVDLHRSSPPSLTTSSSTASKMRANSARSSAVPTVTRMHRSSGATPGMRTNTPASWSRASSARARPPSPPASIATKFVADGTRAQPQPPGERVVLVAPAGDLLDHRRDERGVAERRERARLGDAVHSEVVADAAQAGDGPRRRDGVPDARAPAMPWAFENVRMRMTRGSSAPDGEDRGRRRELDVRLVEHEQRGRGQRVDERTHLGSVVPCPHGVVGVGDIYERRVEPAHRIEEGFEIDAVVAVRHRLQHPAETGHVVVERRVRAERRDHRHSRLDHHPHHVAEHLVDTGAEEHLVDGDAVPRRDGAAQLVRLGVVVPGDVSRPPRASPRPPSATPRTRSRSRRPARGTPRPRQRSSVSGPTNGIVEGRPSTSVVNRGAAAIIIPRAETGARIPRPRGPIIGSGEMATPDASRRRSVAASGCSCGLKRGGGA